MAPDARREPEIACCLRGLLPACRKSQCAGRGQTLAEGIINADGRLEHALHVRSLQHHALGRHHVRNALPDTEKVQEEQQNAIVTELGSQFSRGDAAKLPTVNRYTVFNYFPARPGGETGRRKGLKMRTVL